MRESRCTSAKMQQVAPMENCTVRNMFCDGISDMPAGIASETCALTIPEGAI